MNVFYSILFIGVFSSIVYGQDATSRWQLYLKDRCFKVDKSGFTYDELFGSIVELQKYMEHTSSFFPNYIKDFCSEERKALNMKMDDVATKLKKCLPKEEEYLPGFLKDMFKEFLHFLCHDKGAYSKLYFGSQGKQCRGILKGGNGSQELDVCLNRLFSAVSSEGYIVKREICDDVTTVRKCFAKTLKDHCTNYHSYRDLSETFFGFIRQPCSACISYVNNLLLFISASIIIFYNKFT